MSGIAEATMPLAKPIRGYSRPKVGFLGLGWIGRNRMEAIAQSNLVDIVALSDVAVDTAIEAAKGLPNAEVIGSFENLLDVELDGLVIATPSALHAEQASEALTRGIAVFCQKPLGRNEIETTQVIE